MDTINDLCAFDRAMITRQFPTDMKMVFTIDVEDLPLDPYYMDLMQKTGLTPPNFSLGLQFLDEQDDTSCANTQSPLPPAPSNPPQSCPDVQTSETQESFKFDSLHEYSKESRPAFRVFGNAAQIVRRANQLEIDIQQRAQDRCPPGMFPALYMPETPMENAIMEQQKELEEQFMQEYGLSQRPILIDQVEPVSKSVEGKHLPTELDMANEMVSRVSIRRKGSLLYRYNLGAYELLNENSLQTLVLATMEDQIKISGSSRLLETIPKFLRANKEISIENFSQPDNKVCLEDGVLNTDTQSLEAFTPLQFLTWRLNVKWKDDNGCPNFDRYLNQVTRDDSILIQIFWEAISYILLAPDNRGKKFIYMYGVSNSGKSVLGRLLQSFFPEEFVSSVSMYDLGERFSLGSLVNKRINLCMDLSDGILNEKAISVLKRISGMDTCDCEIKYHPSFSTRLDVKLIFASNFKLRITSNDNALYKRMLLLPFPYAVPSHEQIPNLDKLLASERSGILHRAAVVYQQLKKRNFIFTPLPSIMYDRQQPEVLESTGIDEFISERIIADTDGFTTTEILYNAYLEFCEQNGFRSLKDKHTFSIQMKPLLEKNFQSLNKKRRIDGIPSNGYTNISLL